MTERVNVVLPDDSGPKISTIRPIGKPPIPSATSKPSDPVEIDSTSNVLVSPNFIIEPLPNCFSICPNAAASAFCFSSLVAISEFLFECSSFS